jgi:hypothetical protein
VGIAYTTSRYPPELYILPALVNLIRLLKTVHLSEGKYVPVVHRGNVFFLITRIEWEIIVLHSCASIFNFITEEICQGY